MVTQKIAMASLPDHIKEKIKKYPTNTKESSKKGKAANWRIKYPYKKKLPKIFDGREQWPQIKKNVYQQGACGSCWAFSVCGLLSDRYYILSAGKINVKLSPTRLLLCDVGGLDIVFGASTKGADDNETIQNIINSRTNNVSACYGNTITNGLRYLFIYGACTTTCTPYEYDYGQEMTKLFTPLYANLPHNTKTEISIGKSKYRKFHDPISSLDYIHGTTTGVIPENTPWTNYDLTTFTDNDFLPSCGGLMSSSGDMCINYSRNQIDTGQLKGTPSRFYRLGLYYSLIWKTLEDTNEAMKQDIYKWGPIISVMEIYSNFYTFDAKTEIYEWDKKGALLAYHAIEIVGWGEEKIGGGYVKYWIVKNSWGDKWGDEGFFKIKRGVNECQIENNVEAGLPDFFSPVVSGGKIISGSKYGVPKTADLNWNLFNVEVVYGPDPGDTGDAADTKGKNNWGLPLNALQLYRNRDIAALIRLSLDFGFYIPNPQIKQIDRNLDLSYDFTGGIDPFTGFTRRAMTMYTGLNFEAPITSNEVSFSKTYFGGDKKLTVGILKNPIFIGNYIFYITIIISVVVFGLVLYKKYNRIFKN